MLLKCIKSITTAQQGAFFGSFCIPDRCAFGLGSKPDGCPFSRNFENQNIIKRATARQK